MGRRIGRQARMGAPFLEGIRHGDGLGGGMMRGMPSLPTRGSHLPGGLHAAWPKAVLALVCALFLVLALAFVSCGAKVAEEDAVGRGDREEVALEEEEEEALEAISPEGEIRPEEEENEVLEVGEEFAAGREERLELPEGLDKDALGVPLYPYGSYDDALSYCSDEGRELCFTIYIHTRDSFKDVARWYLKRSEEFESYVDDTGTLVILENDARGEPVTVYVYREMEESGWETTILLERCEQLRQERKS